MVLVGCSWVSDPWTGLPRWLSGKEEDHVGNAETQVRSLGQEDALEEEIAIYSSILAWKFPKDRGVCQAIVHGVEHTHACARTHTHTCAHTHARTRTHTHTENTFWKPPALIQLKGKKSKFLLWPEIYGKWSTLGAIPAAKQKYKKKLAKLGDECSRGRKNDDD